MISNGDSFPKKKKKRRSQLGLVTYFLNYPHTLLNGNDRTNLGALPHVRIALTETNLSLWVVALSCCIDALTAQLHGCDIKIFIHRSGL
jgi:hypothetical protein